MLTIVIEGPDGNTVSYETTTDRGEALEEEVSRYFPQAQKWQLVPASGMEAGSEHKTAEPLGITQFIMIAIAIVTLICLGLAGSMLSTIFVGVP